MRIQHVFVGSAAAAFCIATACGRLPGGAPPTATVWLLPSPEEGVVAPPAALPQEVAAFEGALIVVDSTTLRPVQRGAAATAPRGASRISVVTTYQGHRYHPESIRALTDDSAAAQTFASSVARMADGNGLFIDFQSATADELRRTTGMVRAIADAARARGIAPIGIVVPPGDTVGYPTRILARTADLIVIRLSGEHRPGTAPGPLVSRDWMAREIGMRAGDIGVNRLVAELPLFGYRWDRDGTAHTITYSDAQALVLSEAGAFRRDPATGSLVATSSRNGWTIWIEDAETLASLVQIARDAGIRRFALLGGSGADPAIWARLPSALTR